MLLVLRSNRVERLTDKLMEMLSRPVGGPMDLEWVGVSSLGMAGRLERSVAEKFQIASGILFPFPREILNRICFGDESESVNPFDEEPLALGIFEILPSLLGEAAFEPIAQYLKDEAFDTKRLGLARQAAHTFAEYSIYRPRMVLEWEKGSEDHWQAHLWRALVAKHGSCHIARAAQSFIHSPDARVRKLPFRRLSFFAVPTFAPLYLSVLSVLARFMDVTLYTLSPSMEWWADEGVPDANEEGRSHPLLAAFGRTGGDFQWMLEENGTYIEPVGDLHEDPAVGSSASLLKTLQSDMLNQRWPRLGDKKFEHDDSIEIHSCAGPVRELEVLKDRLLDRFRRDTRLRPEDVAVFAPDIRIYAPFIESVFGGLEHPIPFRIGAHSKDAASQLKAFSMLLEVVTKRLTIRDVFDLLSMDPVREKFGLSIEDVLVLERLSSDAGVRWGIDRAHRAKFDQPPIEENTWRFGMDRMLMSLAMEPKDGALCCGISPFGKVSKDDKERFARFLDFQEGLFDCVLQCEGAKKIVEWTELFLHFASRLLSEDDESNGSHLLLRKTILDIRDDARTAKTTCDMSFRAIREIVLQKLLSRMEGKSSRGAGVTFADISAHRAVPFSVIAVLGMNEGEFPRLRHAPGFDLASGRPMRGDRSVSDDDRFMFLEAILSARDALLITYSGIHTKSGDTVSPSSAVKALASALRRASAVEDATSVIVHPVSPFHARYFSGEDNRLFSYSEIALKGALSASGDEARPLVFFPRPLQDEVFETVELDRLVAFLVAPQKALALQRLGIRFPWAGKSPPEREPVAQGLEDRAVMRMLLERGAKGERLDSLEEEVRSMGLLPLGEAGLVRFKLLTAKAAPTVKALLDLKLGPISAPVPTESVISVEGLKVRVTGEIAGFRSGALTAFSYGDHDYDKSSVALFIRLLQAKAADVLEGEGKLIALRNDALYKVVTFNQPRDPKVSLGDLLDLYFKGLSKPLPLIPSLSLKFAKETAEGALPEVALMRAKRGYADVYAKLYAMERTAFRGFDPFDLQCEPSFANASLRVFAPLLSLVKGGAG